MKKPEKHIYIVSLIVGIVLPLFFNLRLYFLHQQISLVFIIGGISYSFLETFSIYYCTSILTDYLQQKFPWQKNLTKRIVIELFLMSAISTLLTVLNFKLYSTLFGSYAPIESEMSLFDNVIVAIVMSLIIGSLNEATYVISQWKKALIETEQLKRESVESQFSALKNQINPHFLFNSLNTLSSLICISPDKAIEFVNKFSKIYRYVLEVKDKTLVDLNKELEFVNSYFFLQKIRYGENILLEINIDTEYRANLVPPLTLQILVENAIKHNEISDEFPLKISIYNQGTYLFVENSLKLKNTDTFSTGIGINNLKERYSHFSDLLPSFGAERGSYIAKVPLLNDEA